MTNGAPKNGNGDAISIPLPFGGQVSARGTIVVLVILLLAGAYLSYLWHGERSQEHHEILDAINYQTCSIRLNLYIVTAKDPTTIKLTAIPKELWPCLPRFMSEDEQAQRKKDGH